MSNTCKSPEVVKSATIGINDDKQYHQATANYGRTNKYYDAVKLSVLPDHKQFAIISVFAHFRDQIENEAQIELNEVTVRFPPHTIYSRTKTCLLPYEGFVEILRMLKMVEDANRVQQSINRDSSSRNTRVARSMYVEFDTLREVFIPHVIGQLGPIPRQSEISKDGTFTWWSDVDFEGFRKIFGDVLRKVEQHPSRPDAVVLPYSYFPSLRHYYLRHQNTLDNSIQLQQHILKRGCNVLEGVEHNSWPISEGKKAVRYSSTRSFGRKFGKNDFTKDLNFANIDTWLESIFGDRGRKDDSIFLYSQMLRERMFISWLRAMETGTVRDKRHANLTLDQTKAVYSVMKTFVDSYFEKNDVSGPTMLVDANRNFDFDGMYYDVSAGEPWGDGQGWRALLERLTEKTRKCVAASLNPNSTIYYLLRKLFRLTVGRSGWHLDR